MSPLAYLVVAGLIAFVGAAEKYTTKYDNVNIKQILENDRLLEAYFKCLVNKGTCTPDAEELKKNIPDGLATGCSKCSEKQKAGLEEVLQYLIKFKPEMYDELEKLHDPKGTYRKQYAKEAEKLGIKQ